MDSEISTLVERAVGVLVVASTAFITLRSAAKRVSKDIPEYREDRAHGDFITRLREEVTRLEGIIGRMQQRIEELEAHSIMTAERLVGMRADAIEVYSTISRVDCTCLANDQWEPIHSGMRRLIASR